MTVSPAVAHRIPAGWYPDRHDRSRRRWWDGVEWTDYYSAVPQPQLRIVEPIVDPTNIPDETTAHTLVGALKFNDRVPAFILAGLFVGNLVLIGIFLVVN